MTRKIKGEQNKNKQTNKQTNKQKTVVFETECDSWGLQLRGQNMSVFEKKSHFWILLGAFRGHFSNSSIQQNVFPNLV